MTNQNTLPQDEIAQAVDLLERSNQFRVIKAVADPQYKPNEKRPVTCAIVDCEATSNVVATAIPIELGMMKVGFDPSDLSSIVSIDKLSMLNDPLIPSEPGALAVHGISDAELKGQRFDQARIASFLTGVDFIIAHNASYDRPVLSRSIPLFNDMQWMCSMKDVDWAGMGISSRALDYLLYRAGFFHEAHRALADCVALHAVVTHRYLDGIPPLFAMNESRNDMNWIILCDGAPFEAKDAMKSRGYRWNPGDVEGEIPTKCWTTPELTGKPALLNELEWLMAEVYKNRPTASLTAMPIDSLIRYSEGSRLKSFNKKTLIGLEASIASLRRVIAKSAELQQANTSNAEQSQLRLRQ